MSFPKLIAILSFALVSFAPSSFGAPGVPTECNDWLHPIKKTISVEERAVLSKVEHPVEEVDTAHDTEINDPSEPHTELITKSYFKQDLLALFGVNAKLSSVVKTSFRKIRRSSSKNPEALLDAPESKRLLGIHADRYLPKKENGPTTVNSNDEYCGISDRAHGYCWGYATFVRFFHTLAFYDERLPRLEKTSDYLPLLDQIIAGEATIIPGFANFRELSLMPEIELYLKLVSMDLWRSRAIRFSSLNIFKNATKPMKPEAVDNLVSNLQHRLARNEMPKVIFSSLIPSATILGLNTDIHVVLVYRVEKIANGNTRLYLWDINFYSETLVRAPKFLEVTPDHQIHYQPWYEANVSYTSQSDLVASVQFAPENDAENVAMIRSLKVFCESHPEYCQ